MLKPDDFEYLSKVLKDESGLALTPDKSYLINTRLRPILDRHDIENVSALVKTLRSGRDRALKEEVVDAMTTNESLFFRDTTPFQALVEMMIPNLMRARGRGKPIRIWCAAASTGQEPYSVSILVEENARRFPGLDVQIVASDLSQAALRRARLGEYTPFEVGRGMPPDILSRHFEKTAANHYVISPKVKSRIRFQYRNLLHPFDGLGKFDIVFCRNVLIYFDRPTKADVLTRMSKIIPEDGYLILGGPETTLGLCNAFSRHSKWRNVYVQGNNATANVPPQRVAAV